MQTFTVTYFQNPDVYEAAMYDIPYHIDVEGADYDEAVDQFKMLHLGHIWSIDPKECAK